MDTKTITPEEIAGIAKVCHQANKAYCEANGDNSQKDWDEAEEWQRESAIMGVNFRIENPDAGHDAQYNSWMKEKVDAGWMYGEVKDPAQLTHPCIVPFDKLPKFQQLKDALFCATVDSLLPRIDNLSFGKAIEAMEVGKMIARKGWNGKGMFVFKQIPAEIGIDVIPKMQSVPMDVKDRMVKYGVTLKYTNQMAIVNAEGRVDSWVASSSDTFARDWQII